MTQRCFKPVPRDELNAVAIIPLLGALRGRDSLIVEPWTRPRLAVGALCQNKGQKGSKHCPGAVCPGAGDWWLLEKRGPPTATWGCGKDCGSSLVAKEIEGCHMLCKLQGTLASYRSQGGAFTPAKPDFRHVTGAPAMITELEFVILISKVPSRINNTLSFTVSSFQKNPSILGRCELEYWSTGARRGTIASLSALFMQLQAPGDHWPHHPFPEPRYQGEVHQGLSGVEPGSSRQGLRSRLADIRGGQTAVYWDRCCPALVVGTVLLENVDSVLFPTRCAALGSCQGGALAAGGATWLWLRLN
ncbi:hypothetical protein CB1_000949021 [Camelus ferus]|nr:hypothetical protein CB1_000949021 [Camelus ferus]